MHAGQSLQFPVSFFFCFLGEILGVDFFPVFLSLNDILVSFAQFLLDGFQLLP
jgi:hypothetical protein